MSRLLRVDPEQAHAAAAAQEILLRSTDVSVPDALDAELDSAPGGDSEQVVGMRCVQLVLLALERQRVLGVPPLPAAALEPQALGIAVLVIAGLLHDRAPGHSVEVRIPGKSGTAFQCGEGPQHTRGTPPNVVETDAITFVELGAGVLDWSTAVAGGAVRASGSRADLSGLLPVLDPT